MVDNRSNSDDIRSVCGVLESDFLTTGPEVAAFEKDIAATVGADHAIACSSGTAALHIAVAALGIEANDSIVVPAVTFVATANAGRYCGANIIFSDVDPETGLMTPETLLAALSHNDGQRIKAILPVHLAGQCCDLNGIKEIADSCGAAVVDDAAHAIGSRGVPGDQDCRIGDGRYSDMSTFSFHPVKNITSGEGGAVTTNREDLAVRLGRLRHHGIGYDPEEWHDQTESAGISDERHPWYYEVAELGFNYRISDIHSALGRSQLRKLGAYRERRDALVTIYHAALSAMGPHVRPLGRVRDCHPAWHLAIALIDFEKLQRSKAEVMKRLREQGIGSQVHYIPLYRHPYYHRLYGKQSLPGAESYYARALSLPLFPDMSSEDAHYVVGALAEALGINRLMPDQGTK